MLVRCTHHAFPVTRKSDGPSKDTFMGTISADVLMEILKHTETKTFVTKEIIEDPAQRAAIPALGYDKISDLGNHTHRHEAPWKGLLQTYATEPKYADLYIDIA